MIVFDLNGTIADTTDLELNCFVKLFGKNKNYYKRYFGPPSIKMIKQIKPNLSDKEVKLFNHLWETLYLKELKKGRWVSQETIAILKKLRKKFILGIITSAVRKTALLVLKNSCSLFDFILCAENCKTHKPDPQSLIFIMNKYNLKPENVIYVGDNKKDIIFGKNAGVKTIAKVDKLYTEKELKKSNPDLIIKSLVELKCLL